MCSSDLQNAAAVAYARPHEFEVQRPDEAGSEGGLRVILARALAVGPVARLELKREDTGDMIEVEMPTGLYRERRLQEGESLVVRPRKLQVFLKPEGGAAGAQAT